MIETASHPRPIAPGLFTDEEPPRLIGGRNLETGRLVFPFPSGVEGALYEPVPLSRTGWLWSWTVQRFRPKSPPYRGPAGFAPYAVGYVELPGEIIVETRLTDVEFDGLRLGMPVALTLLPVADDGGTAVITYAFRPLADDPA